ncbi:hypothetical protein ZOSMA_4G00210 [Zostera marina]|uniref:Myb-like domain-containing protein n=1 Tax=Zostera marina TaxID=29655 RepID=A0A0K9P0I4_ZOSMR|nr:hypothetical protein ZOSMA_4G00210 [Zostera marina]
MSSFTRSQIIPDWSLHEMLTLVLEINAIYAERGSSTIPAHQKWNLIADNLIALNICRNSFQCRRKWDSMLSEYYAIKDWESRLRYQTASTSKSNGGDSYWCLESDKRKDLKLPIEFDRELFWLIEGFINKKVVNKKVIKGKDHMKVMPEIETPSSPQSSSASSLSLSGGQREKKRKMSRKMKMKDKIMEIFRESCDQLLLDVKHIETIFNKKPNAANIEEFIRQMQQMDKLVTLFGEVISTLDRLNV